MGRRALGELEKLVLLAVLALGDEAYGAEIHREIERRTGRDVVVGSIYTALDRLEKRLAVVSRMGEPTAERGGRRRRFYRVLPAGSEDLARSLHAVDAMRRGVENELAALLGGTE